MCGIAGIITKNGAPPDEGALRRMTDILAHRGPDGDGVWTVSGVGFGHRRLAIIDLSDRASQPMLSSDGKYAITYNGEIYNYRDLRDDLVRKGSIFRSESDTEVVLESYRWYGKECVRHFRGMFAFAIWDADAKKCFIARDKTGKKPLFYRTLSDGSVAFASEMKALRFLEPVTVDDCAIRLFIGLQYVPDPRTGLNEIASLPAAHCGTIGADGVRTEPYCSWDCEPVPYIGDPAQDILSILDESVRLRLQADVTVGAFLSGGIDSSAIVAIAQKHLERPLRTFTMGFPYIGMDERREARMTAKYFGTDHQEFEAQPEDLIGLLEKIIYQYGGPYADSSALPVMLLSREVARQIKVVMVGDGGDELFGGYRRYRAFGHVGHLSHLPGSCRVIAPILGLTAKVKGDPRYERMSAALAVASRDINRAYGELFCGSYFSTTGAQGCFRKEFIDEHPQCDPVAFIARRMGTNGRPLERAMRFDFESYLADDLNVKMDRATMAYGLEARAPFLDQKMVAYALRLPLRSRVGYTKTKVALKRAMKALLPPDIINRPKKGFQVPLAHWFRTRLGTYWKDHCLDPQSPLAAYVKQDEIKKLFEENHRGTDHGNRLWMLLAMSVWLESIKR